MAAEPSWPLDGGPDISGCAEGIGAEAPSATRAGPEDEVPGWWLHCAATRGVRTGVTVPFGLRRLSLRVYLAPWADSRIDRGPVMTLAASLTKLIPISSLRPFSKNPRGSKAVGVEDLVLSFGHTPLLQNILVRACDAAGKEYEVIAGHRRVAAARRKGWAHIEAKVVDVDDDTAEIFSIEENLRRRALDDEPAALARLALLYRARREVQQRQGPTRHQNGRNGHAPTRSSETALIAKTIGQSERETRKKIRVGKFGSPVLKRALAEKLVNIDEASRIAGLPAKEQEREIAERQAKKKADRLPPDLRRAIDSLVFAAKTLKKDEGRVGRDVLAELRVRLEGVSTAIDGLKPVAGKKGGRAPSKAQKANRETSSPRPRGEKVDASGAVDFQPISHNRKLAPVGLAPEKERPRLMPMRPFIATTTVSIQGTCPDSCVFKGSPSNVGGCYVDAGYSRIKSAALDEAARDLTPIDIIAEEARQIDDAFDGGCVPQDGARGGRDLRVHVGGDVGSAEGARLLAKAARRWRARGGGSVFTYTHAWREVPRSAWGDAISVLASVERPEDIERARKRGYPSALVVEEFPNGPKAFRRVGSNARIVPCPAETRQGVTCVSCRLCLDRDLLKMSAAIAFKVHGKHAEAARENLASAIAAKRSKRLRVLTEQTS